MSASQEKIAYIEHYATYDRKPNVDDPNSSYNSNNNDHKHNQQEAHEQ